MSPIALSRTRATTPRSLCLFIAALLCLPAQGQPPDNSTLVFTGGRIIDGTGAPPIENGTLLVRDGRIAALGQRNSIPIPENARHIDINGKTLMPGLINAHGHVGDTRGLETGHYTRENLLRQLALYARYGVTTVNSLGGDRAEGFAIRQEQAENPEDRTVAQVLLAGPVISARTPQQGVEAVDAAAEMDVDAIKIRVDDNLGRTPKMQPAVYQAISERADHHGIPLAVHLYYLEDAIAVLKAGGDFIAHSIRDTTVNEEFIDLMIERDICYSPTLTRELSTFVYEEEPAFFSDPFFLRETDEEIIEELSSPARQQRLRESTSAQQYKQALEVAKDNLKRLSDAGITIAMGTDTGPPARFQGYFEHLELEMMVDSGLTPMQALYSATGAAANCLSLSDTGTLQEGHWADLLILAANPLEDISNTKTLEQVWIAGNRVPD